MEDNAAVDPQRVDAMENEIKSLRSQAVDPKRVDAMENEIKSLRSQIEDLKKAKSDSAQAANGRSGTAGPVDGIAVPVPDDVYPPMLNLPPEEKRILSGSPRLAAVYGILTKSVSPSISLLKRPKTEKGMATLLAANGVRVQAAQVIYGAGKTEIEKMVKDIDAMESYL